MSKKRFTEGMESIFGDTSEDTLQESSPLLSSTSSKRKARKQDSKKSSSAKDFSSDLQSFLQDAFEDSLDQQIEERKKKQALKEQIKVKKRHRKPLGGLDALIRSTVEPEKVRVETDKSKRVTLIFDPKKLEKLKKIARNRKAYLRDVIDEIVADYLNAQDKN